MLYVFQVDTGTTITFDINYALQSVAHLQEAIERECNVPAAQQVLLMSGGECLEPDVRVCSYSAGTDTSPIYLFSKSAIEGLHPPAPSIDYGSDLDIQAQVEQSLSMPASYPTMVARVQLAQQCCALARDQVKICERLVHDQHLQQQGWAAVVANLDDITQMFMSRADVLQQNFCLFLADRKQHMELLSNFRADLNTLAEIPILPALRSYADGVLSPDDRQDVVSVPESEESKKVMSLLRWISAKDNQSSLEQVAEQCSRGLQVFDEKVVESLKADVKLAIEEANRLEMKEIKGLGDRLFMLQQLLIQAKTIHKDQNELAKGFLHNQNRASILGDASVIPDLCESHRRQLLVMLENYENVRDIRRRCTRAKEELSENLHRRLKWIMHVENRMMEVDGRLIMYHESLKRLRRHLEVIQQIHMAPEMYMNAVAEVVRRRTFSEAFLVWASNLACQLMTVHSEEVARRREFQSKFDGHFLNTLFPGLEDTPPPFATQAPPVFDTSLPKLTVEDMESLKSQLPSLAFNMSTPNLDSITQFFLSKSVNETSAGESKDKETDTMRVDEPAKGQGPAGASTTLPDKGGFESETDTDEFEKIGQGAADSKPGSFDGAKQKRQKQLEENLGSTRDEVDRLRSLLKTMKTVVFDALISVRNEMAVLREQSGVEKANLTEMTARIRETLTMYSRECDRHLHEREQALTVDHELEMTDAKKVVQDREDEIRAMKQILMEKETELAEHERLVATMRKSLEDEQTEMRSLQSRLHRELEDALEQARADKEDAVKKVNDERYLEIASLTSSLTECQARIQELEGKLDAARGEQQRAVKEASDKLQMEYKTELETIRGRFKLMAASTMERSPSDSSLEKIDRQDLIELASHEAILAQTKAVMKIENTEAIRTAVEKERADCVAKLDQELELARQVVEDKSREVEMYRLRAMTLAKNCKAYEDTIRQLKKPDARKAMTDKIDSRDDDKDSLDLLVEAALRNESERRGEMCPGVVDSGKYEVDVSESKKVRLESDEEAASLSRRLAMLESDNKRLSGELQSMRESKEAVEAKVEALEADKVRLEIELVKERTKRSFAAESSSSSESRDKDMNNSVAVVNEAAGSRDAATSPEPSRRTASAGCFQSPSHPKKKVPKSAAKLVQLGRVTVSSCNPGDIVLVLWDPAHANYTLFHESSTFYFLNSDCVAALDLGLNPDGTPKRLQTLAEVVDKEYCHARKPENRYRVPLGTKFYRVRVKPVDEQLAASLTLSQQ